MRVDAKPASVLNAAIAADRPRSAPSRRVAQEAGAPDRRRVVIYPGDVIRDDMLADVAERGARRSEARSSRTRSLIVGKVARLTLLPGHAIPFCGRLQSQARRQRRGGQARSTPKAVS